MNISGWTRIDRDGTLWMHTLDGHHLSLSLEPHGWVGEIDGTEITDAMPESGPGEYGAKMLARKMEWLAQRMDPPDETTRAFHHEQYQEQYQRLTP